MTAASAPRSIAFPRAGRDDPTVPDGFVKAAKAASGHLRAADRDQSSLLNALAAGGFPCTRRRVQAPVRRFRRLGELRGKHAPTTRLMLTGDEP